MLLFIYCRKSDVIIDSADDLIPLQAERETAATVEIDKSIWKLKIEAAVQVNLSDNITPTLRPKNKQGRSLADILSNSSLDKAVQVNLLICSNSLAERERESFAVSNDSSHKDPRNITLPDLLSSDSKFFTFTGIHSLDLLDGLISCIGDLALETSTNKKVLSLKDRVILTMVKIKLNEFFCTRYTIWDKQANMFKLF